MARIINKTTNNTLYWKPKQFPISRTAGIAWRGTTVEEAKEDNADNTTDSTDEKIEYFKNRFKNNENVDCTTNITSCPECN